MLHIIASRTFQPSEIVGDANIATKAQESIEAQQMLAIMHKEFNVIPRSDRLERGWIEMVRTATGTTEPAL